MKLKEKEANHARGIEVTSDLGSEAVEEISVVLRRLLADVFALYVKTKNFHWHMSGRHFRDYHLLLDEHAEQIFAMTDDIAERARKIGGSTLHSTNRSPGGPPLAPAPPRSGRRRGGCDAASARASRRARDRAASRRAASPLRRR